MRVKDAVCGRFDTLGQIEHAQLVNHSCLELVVIVMSPVGSQATACVEHKISTESLSYIRTQLTFESSIFLFCSSLLFYMKSPHVQTCLNMKFGFTHNFIHPSRRLYSLNNIKTNVSYFRRHHVYRHKFVCIRTVQRMRYQV